MRNFVNLDAAAREDTSLHANAAKRQRSAAPPEGVRDDRNRGKEEAQQRERGRDERRREKVADIKLPVRSSRP